MARECAPEAMLILKSVMLDAKAPPAARLGAATAILDRGYGKPRQKIDITSILAAFDLSSLSDAELDQLEALFSLAAGPLIDRSAQGEAGGRSRALAAARRPETTTRVGDQRERPR